MFLFNPNEKPMEGAFALDESIGLTDGAAFRVASIYPAEEVRQGLKKGEQVRWPVPPRTALILELAAQ